ncbi:MAG: hypothetical protein AB1485_03605 [Candidatus Thermoplasmatota archaeon]
MLFGKGKIEVYLDKYNYFLGETISGKLYLRLKKAVRARGLKVALIGEQKTTTGTGVLGIATGSGYRRETEKQRIYNFEIPLDGEKEYVGGEYTFQIKIPETLPQPMLPQGTVGTVLKILTGTSQEIDWYVRAYLDVPFGLDVSGKVQVIIG